MLSLTRNKPELYPNLTQDKIGIRYATRANLPLFSCLNLRDQLGTKVLVKRRQDCNDFRALSTEVKGQMCSMQLKIAHSDPMK